MSRARGRFYFGLLARSHLRMYSGAVDQLRSEGYDCRFINLDDEFTLKSAGPALQAAGQSSITLTVAKEQLEAGDILVVSNDWVPTALVELLNSRKQRGIVAVGSIDGCRFAKDNNYRNVDHVLGWGPSCLKYYPQTGIVVGSPEIESMWQDRPRFAVPPFAAVNYKFTYHRQGGRDHWTETVTKACEHVGIEVRLSRHPADTNTEALKLKSWELSDLLRDCSLLVSRPSTAIYQAQAAGKPVVFLPMPKEELVEFADPMGAYEKPKSLAELVRMVRQALAERSSYRERCRSFFEHHVSIDPRRPATERMAAALRDIHAAHVRA